MPEPTVPREFVQRTLRLASRRGLEATPLLLAAGIPLDFGTNPSSRVTVEQLSRITREIWLVTDDELFGLGRHPIPRGTLRMVCLALVHAPDLRSALLRFRDFTAVLPGVPSITVEVDDHAARVGMDVSVLEDPEHLGTELFLAVVHRVLGWFIGRRLALLSIELPYPPPRRIDEYSAVFGRVPVFDAAGAGFSFAPALLDAPLIRSEQELLDWIRHAPNDLYATRDWGSTIADRARAVLEQGLRGTWPTSEEVATRLAFSLPHLRRLLREEGTSLSAIREDLLRDAAIASLALGEESTDALAARLGFSEASAFRRAFRRWTGSSPGAYRSAGSPCR